MGYHFLALCSSTTFECIFFTLQPIAFYSLCLPTDSKILTMRLSMSNDKSHGCFSVLVSLGLSAVFDVIGQLLHLGAALRCVTVSSVALRPLTSPPLSLSWGFLPAHCCSPGCGDAEHSGHFSLSCCVAYFQI